MKTIARGQLVTMHHNQEAESEESLYLAFFLLVKSRTLVQGLVLPAFRMRHPDGLLFFTIDWDENIEQ